MFENLFSESFCDLLIRDRNYQICMNSSLLYIITCIEIKDI